LLQARSIDVGAKRQYTAAGTYLDDFAHRLVRQAGQAEVEDDTTRPRSAQSLKGRLRRTNNLHVDSERAGGAGDLTGKDQIGGDQQSSRVFV
jgi:hypothetical protein